jgi:hypothetical protein
MIIGINKEEGDSILTDFLVDVCKKIGTKECAEESYKIMDDFNDSQLVISIIITKSIKKSGIVPEEVTDFEVNILSALATMFSTCDESDVPPQFKDLFFGTEQEVSEKIAMNKKLLFSVQAFVSAFYHFTDFEKKYPEITKTL